MEDMMANRQQKIKKQSARKHNTKAQSFAQTQPLIVTDPKDFTKAAAQANTLDLMKEVADNVDDHKQVICVRMFVLYMYLLLTMRLDVFLDDFYGKNRSKSKLSYGQLIVIYIAAYCASRIPGLNAIQHSIGNQLIESIFTSFGIKVEVPKQLRKSLATMLGDISTCTKQIEEMSLALCSFVQKKMANHNQGSALYLNTSSSSNYDQLQQELFKLWSSEEMAEAQKKLQSVLLTFGYSRDNKQDCVQIVEALFVDDSSGLPLALAIFDGNKNDLGSFPEIIRRTAPTLKGLYKNLKYLVCDAAGASENLVNAVRDNSLHIITRLCSNTGLVSKLQQEHEQDLQPIPGHAHIRAALIKAQTWCGHAVTVLLIRSKTYDEYVSKRANYKAELSMQRYTKQLNHLKRRGCCSKKGLTSALNRLKQHLAQDGLTLTNVEPSKYVEVKKNPKGRRPTVPKKLEAYLAKATVERVLLPSDVAIVKDEAKIVETLNQESFMAIVTTDTEREWSAVELLELYGHNILVEQGMGTLKHKDNVSDTFSAKNPLAISGHAVICLASVLMIKVLNQLLKYADSNFAGDCQASAQNTATCRS